MSREKLYSHLIIGLIIFGSALRLMVYWVSPPTNAYDDHLETINIYAQDFNRPTPFQCWECYQPPLYYYLGAAVLNAAKYLGGDQKTCWKIVQGINPILSIILLIVALQILRFFKLHNHSIAVILSFIVVLPRDIFTSVMIGNDYLLVFFSILAFYLFCKTMYALRKDGKVITWFALLVLIATLGSLSKQHGLLIYLLPGVAVLLMWRKAIRKMFYWAAPILVLGVIFPMSEVLWKYNQTGEILVSNQHYFDYAEKQYPGSVEKIEFFTFRIVELYNDPFISESTASSFLTELFARTFFDYEWRFISPKIPKMNTLGQIGYTIGLVWILFYIAILASWFRKKTALHLKKNLYPKISKAAPALLSLLFLTVPLLQTLRFPYFSSMKSMFMLSGIIIALLTIGSLLKEKSLPKKMGIYMIGLNVSYGILLVITIYLYLGISLDHLHGPLWQLPER